MSEMPMRERGWLDSHKVGDHVYLFCQTGSFRTPTLDFRRGLITKATKTQIVVVLMRQEQDDSWVATTIEYVFRRGAGRTEWDPYRGEGEQPGDRYRSGRYSCYPITPKFTKYFEALIEENFIEKQAESMSYRLSQVKRSTWVEYGPARMKQLLDELEKIEAQFG